MKYPLGTLVTAGALIFAIEALAQSQSPRSTSPQSPTAAPSPTPIQTVTGPAAPVNPSKRFACRAAAQKFQGQDRGDQMQLCVAQARLDCLKEAIDQKIVGPERRDFVRNCVGE
jgi:hypothetical protein